MEHLVNPKLVLTFIISSLLFLSCKQPETVVVTEEPSAPSPVTEPQDTVEGPASFMQLNIGETDRIPSLDPLFAENASTMRALQLIYEGLVRYNEKGELIPAIAKEWKVSPDSLTYRFTLRNNIYYHDSNAFNTGIGRRLVAEDVKFVFERMAWLTVPDQAAKLFMATKGFEPFYREQHEVLNPAERQLSGVNGINIPNDSTVVFTLTDKDSNFLDKLAAPLAVVYPREAINRYDPSAFKPVGTGPFIFSQKRGSRFIFSRFDNYHQPKEPVLNRVDVIEIADSPDLTGHLKQQNLHFVPQPGPQLLTNILDTDGQLINSLSASFSLDQTPGRTYHLLSYNPQSTLEPAVAKSLIQHVDTSFFPADWRNFIEVQTLAGEAPGNTAATSDTINVAFTSDPFMKGFLRQLADTLKQEEVTLQMLDIRTPVKSTGLFTNTYIPLYSADSWPDTTNALIGFSNQPAALSLDSIRQLNFNRFPWWMDLRTTTLSETDNLGQ